MNIVRFLLITGLQANVLAGASSIAWAQRLGDSYNKTEALQETVDGEDGNLRPVEIVCKHFPNLLPEYCAKNIPWFCSTYGEFYPFADYCAPSSVPSAPPSSVPSARPSSEPSKMPTVPSDGTLMQGNTFPATNGQTTNMKPQSGAANPIDVVCGAIQSVLAHPTDPNICFAGAVNGGVWRTTSCMADEPMWEPLTDDEDSLSVGDMVFDPEDPSGNTIAVAIGTRSSFAQSGGIGIGILYTTNALASKPNWKTLDNQAVEGFNFRTGGTKFTSIFVRGNLMLAAVYFAVPFTCNTAGVWRSADGGNMWTNVLPGIARAIAADPNDLNRFYATVDFAGICGATVDNGVFTSADGGVTWTPTATVPGTVPILPGSLNNAKLSVSAQGSRVWSALLRNGQAYSISFSDDQGTSWTKLDNVLTPNANGLDYGLNPRPKPGNQGAIHFSLLASATNMDLVFVGGDRQDIEFEGLGTSTWPNFLGAQDFTGRLFRGDASVTATGTIPSPQWEHLTDSDEVTEIPGGGTGSSSGPHADSRDLEFRADGVLLEGNDGGIAIRTSPEDNTGDWFGLCGNLQTFETHNVAYEPLFGSVVFGNQDTGTIWGRLGNRDTFTSLEIADGNDCMIDFTSDANFIFIYGGIQRLSLFWRWTLDKTTGIIVDQMRLTLPGRGSFVSIAAMNPASQSTFDVAVDTIRRLIAQTTDRGLSFVTYNSNLSNEITAMIYSNDGNVLYATDWNSWAKVTQLSRCIAQVCTPMGTLPPENCARHLAVDPQDNDKVYAFVVESTFRFYSPALYVSMDGGNNWQDISVAGSLLDSAALGGSVTFINNAAVAPPTVVVGTSNGALVPDDSGGWRQLASGLPTVAVLDMVYEPMDDMLVLATLGRGVWFLPEASQVLIGAPGRFEFERPTSGTKLSIDPSIKQPFSEPPEDASFSEPPEDAF